MLIKDFEIFVRAPARKPVSSIVVKLPVELARSVNSFAKATVLRELYAAQHAVGVVGWLEFDAKVQDQQKIAVLKMGS